MHMEPIFDIKYCTIDAKDQKKCFAITISKSLALTIVGFMAVIIAVSFFFGWGAGGIDLGIKYLAMSGTYALLAVLLLIPVVGLVILIGFLPAALADTVTLLGIAANTFTSALGAAVFWFGLVGQILVLVKILIKILNMKNGKPQMPEL